VHLQLSNIHTYNTTTNDKHPVQIWPIGHPTHNSRCYNTLTVQVHVYTQTHTHVYI